MFLAASILKFHITSAYDHPVQPLTTILNNLSLNKLLNTKWCDKRKLKPNFKLSMAVINQRYQSVSGSYKCKYNNLKSDWDVSEEPILIFDLGIAHYYM